MNSKATATTIIYQLPDGRIVNIAWDLCRGRSFIDFTLVDGRIVMAVICAGQR